jgi:RHS repeat-associated protein
MAPRIAARPALITLAILAALTGALMLLPVAWAGDESEREALEKRTRDGVVRERTELRTSSSRTFATEAGSNLTRLYPEPVNFRSGGKWEAIDSTLVADPAPGYALTNRAADYDVALPDSAGGPVAVTDGSDRVTFALDGARGAPRSQGASATYANALPGIDLTYEVQAGAVKESIVLDSPAAGSKYSFRVETSDGLRARANDAGGIDFVRDGKVRMSFAPPFMEDSAPAPARSESVRFELSEDGSGYRVVLRADAGWLSDPDRVYPVTVDPTTTVHTSDDCYMASGSGANTSYCGYTDPLITVGTDAGGAVRRGFMRVDASVVPKTAEVLRADLMLYVESGTQRNVDLHRVTRESTTARTWNKYDGVTAWTTPGGDISASPDGSNAAFGGTVGLHRLSARKLAQGWVDGSIPNYGVVVKDNGATAGVLNITGDAATNDPVMEIAWAHRTGEQDRWTFAEQGLSDRMSLKTNVANGNLLLEENDIQIPGIAGHDLDFSRNLNNLEIEGGTSTDDLGKYWRHTGGWDVWLRSSAAGATQNFNGPSNFWAPYDKTGATTYATPTGMNADLKKNADGTHTLTYRQSQRKLTFNTAGMPTSDEDRNGNKITYSYGGPGGKLSAVKDTHDQGTANNTLTLAYTTDGYIDTVTDRSSPARVWNYDYTGNKLTSYVNPDGRTTTYGYDANGSLTDITDPRGHKTKITYDAQFRVTSIQRFTDALATVGPITRYEYPTTLSTQCQGVGGTGEGKVVGETIEKDPLWTTGTAHTTKYCWDKLLRVQKSFDGRGEARSQTYTSNSDVTTLDSMGSQAWSMSYSDDRAKEGSSPAATGQTAGMKMTYGYDEAAPLPQSNPLHWLPSSLTDTENKTTNYSYDAKGNTTGVKLPLTGQPTIGIVPNTNGTTQSITDANGTGTTAFTYETDWDLDTIDRPSTLLTETLDYDAVHRLTSHANANMPNVTETYVYDKVDRMTSLAYNAASAVTYGYDYNGNLTSRIDATGTTTYTYDRLNRLTQESLPGGRVNNYTYDAASNLATLQDAGGTTTYTYGASNLLATMLAPGEATATTFTYNKDAQRTKTTYPNGVALSMDFEDKTAADGTTDLNDTGPNRLKSIEAKHTATNTVLTRFAYGYTPDTALCGGTNADTSLRHSVTNKDNVTSKYCYDPLNRLTKASSHNGSTYDYTLDANGNITKRVKGAATTSFGYDTANRLCWLIGSSQASAGCTAPTGATTFTHDASGNMTASSGALAISHNSKGQSTSMTSLSGTGALTASYAGTNQVERFTSGATTFTNNALGVGAETTGTATTYYRRDNEGGLVSMRQPSTGNPIHYYAFDGIGSVSALTGSAGTAAQRYDYDPYGVTTPNPATGGVTNPWRYASSYQDSNGLYKMGLRYYSPELMRWTQQDPLEQPADPTQANRYGYGAGDPINNADPDGDAAAAVVAGGAVVVGVTAAAVRTVVVAGVSAGAVYAINQMGKKKSRGGPGKAPTGKGNSNRWPKKTSKKAPHNPNKKGPPPGTERR